MIQTRIATGVVKGPTDPATGFKGKLFFNTSSDVLKVHDGSSWNVLDTGTADLVGPGSSTDNAIVRFDGTTGKLCQNSVVTIADTTGAIAGSQSIALSGSSSGVVTIQTAAAAGTWALTLPTNDGDSGQFLQTNGSGVTSWQTVTAGIGGSTGATDNAILRADGTGGATLQNSAVTISDAGTVTSPTTIIADNAEIGDVQSDGYPGIKNKNLAVGIYALIQGAAGDTYVNGGVGQSVNFRIADVTKWSVNASGHLVGIAGVGLLLTPVAFASLPAGSEGMMAWVNDSNTSTWGATIAGGGANKVLAVYNGTNWTVVGK